MSATEPKTVDVPECSDCEKKPTLEKRELIGLVVCCDCQTMSVRVASTLPEVWSK